MSSQYERELRQVLAGVPKGVEGVIRSCSPVEKERMRLVLDRPFLLVRAAGSGMEGTGDLLALRGDLCFPIEVKSTKADKLYLSGRTKDQYDAMVNEGERCHLMPLYAHRLKGVRGDSWRVFRVETSNLTGRLRQLEKWIPPFPKTRNGSNYLHWESGMPLNQFVALLCSTAGSEAATLAGLTARASASLPSDLPDTSSDAPQPKPLGAVLRGRTQTNVLAELARRRS